jgi:hypothetical protein
VSGGGSTHGFLKGMSHCPRWLPAVYGTRSKTWRYALACLLCAVLILWQFAHTNSHLDISSRHLLREWRVSSETQPIFTPLTWSKSMAIGGKTPPQSVHGAFFNNAMTAPIFRSLLLNLRRLYLMPDSDLSHFCLLVTLLPPPLFRDSRAGPISRLALIYRRF